LLLGVPVVNEVSTVEEIEEATSITVNCIVGEYAVYLTDGEDG